MAGTDRHCTGLDGYCTGLGTGSRLGTVPGWVLGPAGCLVCPGLGVGVWSGLARVSEASGIKRELKLLKTTRSQPMSI